MDHWEEWQNDYQRGTLVIWPSGSVRKLVNLGFEALVFYGVLGTLIL